MVKLKFVLKAKRESDENTLLLLSNHSNAIHIE